MKNLLLIFACAALLCGCASTPQQQLNLLVADARDVGEFGTRVVLMERPDFRDELEATVAALKALEATPDPLTVDALVGILAKLPVKQLQTDKAQLYILGGKVIIRRAVGDYQLGTLGMRPIVQALREGMEEGLGPP
jgi:hypothetical protein